LGSATIKGTNRLFRSNWLHDQQSLARSGVLLFFIVLRHKQEQPSRRVMKQRASIYIKPLNIRAREIRPQPLGLPVVDLSFNELPWPPSASLQTAIDTTSASAHRYGNPSCEKLRNALADSWSLNPDQLICGNGSEELLDVIGRVFARTGDEILISAFGYIQFPIVANRVGATLVKAPEHRYTSSVDALLEHVSDRTTVVFLANPNNPTGTMLGVSELHRLAQALPDHCVLVLDLAYGEFAGEGYCAAVHELVAEFDNLVVTRTFSKAYGLAGLRIGWLHAPEWMIPALYAARGMGTANAVGQAAAMAALAEQSVLDERVETIVSERERVQQQLEQLGYQAIRSSTNFIMAGLHDGDADSADAIATALYDEAGFIVNRTRETGLEKFIRFSLSLPAHNDQLLNCLARFIDQHPERT
jgi:histidinol-phosphate aminotransferase